MKKLLVTGHLGFIGSAFCEKAARDFQIVGLDYGGWGSMPENCAAGITSINGDIADASIVRALLDQNKVDAIVNFAAESHVDRSIEGDLPFWNSNVMGARVLAIEAIKRKIRFLQVSTDEVYGDALEEQRPWTEKSPSAPKNPYSVTKAAAEMMLVAYQKTHGLDLVITRGANTIGPRQFPEKAIPKAVACFLEGKPFPLFKSPARRMWLYVEDHVDGVLAALLRGKTGEIYNIAPSFQNEAYTQLVIEKVLKQVGKGEIKLVEDRKAYDLRYWMDAGKASRDLAWKAQNNLEDSIKKTVEWYLKNSAWLKAAQTALARGTSA